MKLKIRFMLMLGSLGLITLVPSCQSTSTTSSTAGTDAIMCDKCKTVWVRKPETIGSPGRFQTIVYRDSKTMTCQECQLTADNFWKTGSMKHSCTHCGGSLTHCTQH